MRQPTRRSTLFPYSCKRMRAFGVLTAVAGLTVAVLALRPTIRRCTLRREIRHALLILQRLQERAGSCAAYKEDRECRRATARALAVAGAARELVDDRLLCLADAQHTRGSATLQQLRRRAARVEVECEACLPRAPPGAAVRRPMRRDELLQDEQRSLDTLDDTPGVRALRRALSSLRALESDLDFQAALLREQMRVHAQSGYSRENFAYGSTPLSAWLAVFRCDAVAERVRELTVGGDGEAAGVPAGHAAPPSTQAAPPNYVVFGSSLGWLCLYGACVYGLRAEGVELLPKLCECARAAAAAARVPPSGASFVCADALAHDVTRARLLMLTSQCWDASLCAAVRAKLLAELPDGALVIDYTPALGNGGGGGGGGGGASGADRGGENGGEASSEDHRDEKGGEEDADVRRRRRTFALVAKVNAPVSWDAAHQFWVWRCV